MPAALLLALALASPPPWPGAEAVPDPPPLDGTVRIGADQPDPDGGAWYVAKRTRGVYDHPTLVNRDGGSFPVWTAKPGVLAFTRTPASGGIYLTR